MEKKEVGLPLDVSSDESSGISGIDELEAWAEEAKEEGEPPINTEVQEPIPRRKVRVPPCKPTQRGYKKLWTFWRA